MSASSRGSDRASLHGKKRYSPGMVSMRGSEPTTHCRAARSSRCFRRMASGASSPTARRTSISAGPICRIPCSTASTSCTSPATRCSRKAPRAAVLALLAEAKRRSIPFSVDPASYSFLQEVGAERFLDWTRGAQLFFPNADEAAVLSGEAEPQGQLAMLARLFHMVALKRGARGAVASEGERRWSAPAPSVEVVDTSGAGDAFLGGFVAAVLARRGAGGGVAAWRRTRVARRHDAGGEALHAGCRLRAGGAPPGPRFLTLRPASLHGLSRSIGRRPRRSRRS